MADYGGAGVHPNYTGGALTGSSYGDLSANNSFKLQRKFLPIAMKLLTFSRFAQRDVKPLKEGLELRFRRYEKISITGKDTPIAEGVTPNFENVTQTTIKTTLNRYGTYVNVTDLMMAVHTDPLLQQISERLFTMAGELKDFLDFKIFRAGTNIAYGGTNRANVNKVIGNCAGITATGTPEPSALLLQTAVRFLEGQDAKKITSYLKASPNITTAPLRPSFVAVGHTDLRQDIENLPGYVPAEKYSDPSDRMEGEIGSCLGVRFILTTQAVPYANAGTAINGTDNAIKLKNTTGSTASDVYPVVIMAQDFGGTATLAGRDSIRPKVVLPKPGPGDPLGQRGTVAVDFFHSAILLNTNWHYVIECGASSLS